MDAKKREIRNLECQLAFREATGEASEKGILGTISGRAICFNAESQVLDEYGQTFREVIAPEAATMEFLNTQDVKINMLHSRELTFGRAKRGMSGNARLSVDREGVNFEVDVPNCDLGIRARELTKAGVYDGCSFEFWPDQYDIEEREGKIPLVRHTRFRAITALTLGMDPAYLQTSLHARELLDSIEHREEKQTADDEKKVEQEEKAAEEAEKKEEKAQDNQEQETDEQREAREKAEREAQEAKEQQEREAVAVIRMRRNRLSLMNRDLEDLFV